MYHVTITNSGQRPVDRLGVTFLPGKPKEMELMNIHQLWALQAVRVLEVVVQEQPKKAAQHEVQEDVQPEGKPAPKKRSRKK